MVSGLIHRMISGVILMLALYAAITVPIGRRTMWGHLVAIFSTQPARDAAHDLEHTGIELGERILGNGLRPPRGAAGGGAGSRH